MQRKQVLYLVAILVMVLAMLPVGAAAQPAAPNASAADTVGNDAPLSAHDLKVIADAGPAAPAAPVNPDAVLYDNGPLVTNPAGGAGGADASALQTAVLNSTYGFGHQIASGNRVADDFTVPAGGWNISTITFFAYQTGSTTTSTINNVNLRIWDGVPGVGNVVFGDTTTNRLAGSSWSNIYRTLDTGLLASDRPIMADVVTVNTTLPAGTYWLDWSSGGTLASGPWAPPVTLVGQTAKPGANGMQSLAGAAFAPAIDTGSGAVQDFPFVIEGQAAGGGPSISLRKTVGTTPGVCAATSNISVAPGTTVYYCYTVTNNGTVTLETHDLSDDQLGTIFTGFSYSLTPGNSVSTVDAGLTISTVINAPTTNVGTWTAYEAVPDGGGQASAQATAVVNITPGSCPAGTVPNVLYSTDFEAGADGFTHSAAVGTDTWALSGANPHSGSQHFHADDISSISDQRLVSPAVVLPSGQDPVTIQFWNAQDMEPTFDGGIIEVTSDGGATWTQVPNANLLTDPYDGALSTSFGNPLGGLQAWWGPQAYLNSVVDVTGYAGQTVQFRLRLGTDSSVSHPGWDVDDVLVQSCAPAVVEPICQVPELTIPDNDPVGASTTINVPSGGSLADLNVYMNVTHTWVGDLILTLEHVDTGSTAVLFDRPGVPPGTFGCSGDNIDNYADDEATLTFENDCANANPAYVPGDPYQPNSPLAVFDGEDLAGDWTLTVSDNASGDTGTLNEWCLVPGDSSGEDPNIDVNPLSMESTQPTNTQTQQQLTVANTGGGTLDWVIDEEETVPNAAPPAGAGSVTKLAAPEQVQRSAKELTSLMEAANAEVVADGSFEAGTPNPFWNESSTNFGTPLCDLAGCGNGGGTSFPLTGNWWSWFGGIAAYEDGNVSQSVVIPSGGPATLSFWVMNGTCSGDPADYLRAYIDGTQLWETTGVAAECGTLSYRQVTVDVSAYADDGAHLLEFNSEVFGTDTTNFALDDVSLDAGGGGGGEPCEVPSDIPWLSLDAYNGSNAGGTDTMLTVTFDSTGLANGVYTGNLCVTSNDPDPGPGNGTDQVIVPVTLTVRPPTAVALTDLAAETDQMPAPVGVPMGVVAAAGLSMAMAAGYALRRRRTQE